MLLRLLLRPTLSNQPPLSCFYLTYVVFRFRQKSSPHLSSELNPQHSIPRKTTRSQELLEQQAQRRPRQS